ncbi:MAG: GNAT family N-acetyltransferase [Pseudomonadota bacterium]
MQLETDRTRIQPLDIHLLKGLQSYYLRNAAHLDQWEPERPVHFHSTDSWHKRFKIDKAEMKAGRSLKWVALEPDSDRVIGVCNFTQIFRGPFQSGTLGFSVDASRQGQGLMYEVTDRTLQFMFEKVGLHRIAATHMPTNRRSAQLLERLGFEQEGIAPAYLKIAGRWETHVLRAKLNPADLPVSQITSVTGSS